MSDEYALTRSLPLFSQKTLVALSAAFVVGLAEVVLYARYWDTETKRVTAGIEKMKGREVGATFMDAGANTGAGADAGAPRREATPSLNENEKEKDG